MVDLGMPTLIELPELEDCAALCRELGLQFLELNMDLPQYQVSAIDPTRFQAAAEAYGLYYTIHLSENLNVCSFDPLVAEAYRHTVELTIHLAKQLHIPVLNMHLSPGVYFTLPNRRVYVFEEYQDCYHQSLRIFRDECEAAIGQADLKICGENTTGYAAFQQQALAMLLESHAFALTLDIGHSHRAACRDEPFLLEHSKRLHHFHLFKNKRPKRFNSDLRFIIHYFHIWIHTRYFMQLILTETMRIYRYRCRFYAVAVQYDEYAVSFHLFAETVLALLCRPKIRQHVFISICRYIPARLQYFSLIAQCNQTGKIILLVGIAAGTII